MDRKRAQDEVNRLLSKLVEALKDRFGQELVSVVLFGSFARGDFHGRSDIDLLIVIEELPPSQFERSRLFDEAVRKLMSEFKPLREMGYLCQFMPIMKSREEAAYHSPIYLDMIEEGVILYDKDGFLESVLRRMKRRLEELGARRKFLKGGGWYWDLKPDYKPGEVIEI
jgi:hypothetical protein